MKPSRKNSDYLILEALKQCSGYISGEELAKKLKISRQALCKRIAGLNDKSYIIEATPHLGYKFVSAPDKLYPEEIKYGLATKILGNQIYHYETADSTQSLAWDLGLAGAVEGTVIFSETQKKGKGRIQRRWISPRGGIYFSFLLRPEFIKLSEISKISLVVSLACARAIKKSTGIECHLKWPNDIILGDKKLGGILCEVNAETDRVHFVVVGVGININSKDLPPEATSLLLWAKHKFNRPIIAKAILQELELCYQQIIEKGFTALLKQWSQLSMLWGRRLQVKIFDQTVEGEACGIDEGGYLLLRSNSGLKQKVSAGDSIKIIVN